MCCRAWTEDQAIREPRSHHRDTEGYRFFETWKVASYVQRHFHPDKVWADSRSATPRVLSSVSHWVGAPKVGLLLMEPIIPTKTGLQRDLIEIRQRFASYRLFLDGADAPDETRKKTKLYVYVLPGGRAHDRNEALTAFASVKATAIDTDSESARQSLIGEILALGRAANPEMNLSGPTN